MTIYWQKGVVEGVCTTLASSTRRWMIDNNDALFDGHQDQPGAPILCLSLTSTFLSDTSAKYLERIPSFPSTIASLFASPFHSGSLVPNLVSDNPEK